MDGQTDRQTDISTSRAAPLQLKMLGCDLADVAVYKQFSVFLIRFSFKTAIINVVFWRFQCQIPEVHLENGLNFGGDECGP